MINKNLRQRNEKIKAVLCYFANVTSNNTEATTQTYFYFDDIYIITLHYCENKNIIVIQLE